MAFEVVTHATHDHPDAAAAAILAAFPGGGSLVLTGGTTVHPIYPRLAAKRLDWSDVTVCFSDERCVPPDHADSNYGMANRLFLEPAGPGAVHRMPGELPPERGAAEYAEDIRGLVDHGFDLLLLGMGADCHIGAMFPGSPALDSTALVVAVDRPDGLKGLTLTGRAMLSARRILLLVTGSSKAAAVARVVKGDEEVTKCPARMLAGHPSATFILDEAAAAEL